MNSAPTREIDDGLIITDNSRANPPSIENPIRICSLVELYDLVNSKIPNNEKNKEGTSVRILVL
jgi:hypothetical protein